MQVAQIYELVNTALTETLGEANILKEDLTNLVDMGNAVMDIDAVDHYVKTLTNVIGKDVYNTRVYKGTAPKVLMDSWEFGSILRKSDMDIPEAVENPAWNLQDGQNYSDTVFHKPTISTKFYNSKTTFEVDMSFTDMQVKESFRSAEDMASFILMIKNKCQQALDIAVENMIERTINNFMASKMIENNGVIDLLAMYNATLPVGTTPLTPEQAIMDIAFQKYACYQISLFEGRLKKVSTVFNAGGKQKFTNPEDLHIILLDNFAKASDVYLQADTYHNEITALPNYETVPYWQGIKSATGTYTLEETGSFNIKNELGEVSAKYVIGVMFDRLALGVTNQNQRVRSAVANRGEFYNNFYKEDCSYFNDLNENGIVFVLGLNSSTVTPAESRG